MFLRSTKRFKDGKVHYYWSMVENVRVGRRVFRIARGEAEPPKAVAGVRRASACKRVEGFLGDIRRELKAKTYRASPVKRVYISRSFSVPASSYPPFPRTL